MNAKTFASLLATALMGLASASAHALATPPSMLGSAIPAHDAQRVISIRPDTRWINVEQGQSVKFVTTRGDSFGVRFDGIRSKFDLNALAPAGALDHDVTAYVADLRH